MRRQVDPVASRCCHPRVAARDVPKHRTSHIDGLARLHLGHGDCSSAGALAWSSHCSEPAGAHQVLL
jgi:hypothetical protein